MIVVNFAPEYRTCNCCYSKEKVIEIAFMAKSQGSVVALYENCRKELKKKIEEVDNINIFYR